MDSYMKIMLRSRWAWLLFRGLGELFLNFIQSERHKIRFFYIFSFLEKRKLLKLLKSSNISI